MNRNKILIIVGIVLAIIIVAVVAFIMFRQPEIAQQPGQQNAAIVGLADNQDYVTYFNASDKSFYKGQQKVLTLSYEPLFISYAADGSKALLISDVQNILQPIQVVDFKTLTYHPLSPYVINAALSPDSLTLAYHYNNPNEGANGIYVSDYRGANPRKLYTLTDEGDTSYAIRWVDRSSIVVLPVPPEIVQVPLFVINTSSGAYSLAGQGYFLDVKPDNTGNYFAVLTSDGAQATGPSVGLYDLSLLNPRTKIVRPTSVQTSLIQSAWSKTGSSLYSVGSYNGQFGLYKVDGGGTVSLLKPLAAADWNITEIYVSSNDQQVTVVSNGQVYPIWSK